MNQTKPKDGFLVWPDSGEQMQYSDLAAISTADEIVSYRIW